MVSGNSVHAEYFAEGMKSYGSEVPRELRDEPWEMGCTRES